MKSERLTKKALAERFGVDVRTISNWMAAGMPSRVTSGRPEFSWPDCREWRDEQIRNDARATRHAGGSEDYKVEMAELNLRERRAEVESAEMDVAERRRQTVTVEYMAGEEERILLSVRARLLAIPGAWSPPLGLCTGTVELELKLRDLVNDMMPVLQLDVEGDGGEDDDEEAVPA